MLRILLKRILVFCRLYVQEEYQHFEYPVRRPLPRYCKDWVYLCQYLEGRTKSADKLEVEEHILRCFWCQTQYVMCLYILTQKRHIRWPDQGVQFPISYQMRKGLIERLLSGQPYYECDGGESD